MPDSGKNVAQINLLLVECRTKRQNEMILWCESSDTTMQDRELNFPSLKTLRHHSFWNVSLDRRNNIVTCAFALKASVNALVFFSSFDFTPQ